MQWPSGREWCSDLLWPASYHSVCGFNCLDLRILLRSRGEKKDLPNKPQHQRITQQASVLTQGMAESPNYNPAAQVSASPIFLQVYCQLHCGITSVSSLVSPYSITLVAQKSQEDRGTWHWCPSERKFQQDKMAHHIHHMHLLDQASYQCRKAL